jgi:flagellar biosynthesis protein FlhG
MMQPNDMKTTLEALSRPLTVAVTSGKGGVGKSVISLSLALKYASDGIRTLLIDADLGLGNQHILTGQSPVFTMEDVLSSACKPEEAALQIADNLSLLPASNGFGDNDWSLGLNVAGMKENLEWLKTNFDLLIVDSGAGISSKVTTAAKLSDIVLLVTTPDLAAVADSYAVAKYLVTSDPSTRIGIVVNRADTDNEGSHTAENVRQMMIKFLRYDVPATTHVCEYAALRSILLNHSILAGRFGDSRWSEAVDAVSGLVPNCIPGDLTLWSKAHWGAEGLFTALNLKSENDDINNIASEPRVNSALAEGSLLTSRKDSV